MSFLGLIQIPILGRKKADIDISADIFCAYYIFCVYYTRSTGHKSHGSNHITVF